MEAALETARARYSSGNTESRRLYEEACRVFPGGNTRTSLFYVPFPLTIVRGIGATVWDADGHKYRDFLGEYTAGLYGHSDHAIRGAIDKALEAGIDLGAHNVLEAELARMIRDRFRSMELLRFTNSGTEANLMALCAARAITGRNKILVFDGSYHGGVLSFERGANCINAPFEFVVAEYNNVDSALRILDAKGRDFAAVLVEPMLGACGCIPADGPFLEALREATTMTGTYLIFDEVMTSRLWLGGLQKKYGICPDLTTLGKYVGGGLSFGAFGGKAEIMSWFDARRRDGFPHAGTFNNNVLSMAAGIAGMNVYEPGRIHELNSLGDRLRRSLNRVADLSEANMQFTGIGSMMNMHLRTGRIRNAEDAAAISQSLKWLVFFELVERGIWLGRQGMLVLSLPTSEADCSALVEAVSEVIEDNRDLLVSGGLTKA